MFGRSAIQYKAVYDSGSNQYSRTVIAAEEQFDREHILIFLQKIQGFSGFFVFFVFWVCFESVFFCCFASIPKQRVSKFRLNQNKQKNHPNSLKESIFGYFSENLGLFRFVTKQICLFWLFRFYTKTESFNVSIEPKQTEDPPKQFEREYIWVFFRKFRVVSVCYETVLFVSDVSIQVRNTETS